VSFSEIKRIELMVTGDDKNGKDEGGETGKKAKSIHCQAFELFLQGRPPVQVAIDLNLTTDQAIKIYKDYLTLQKMSKIVSILNKYRNSIPAFITWFGYIEKNNVKPNDITDAIDYIKNMQPLHQQKEDLENEIETLESERDFLLEGIRSIKNLSNKAY
jgi:hypothetical protein